MGFVPAGSFLVAGLATVAGVRWALAGPGIVIAAAAGLALARGGRGAAWTDERRGATKERRRSEEGRQRA
jgi:hypothetical protein